MINNYVYVSFPLPNIYLARLYYYYNYYFLFDYVNYFYQQLLLYIIYSIFLSFYLFVLTNIVSQPNADYLLVRFVFVD